MELTVTKHPNEDEMSLSTDVFRFLQQDHNLLSNLEKKCFHCEICSKPFVEENDLHYHRLDHIIDKPLFICDDPVEEHISEEHTRPIDDEMCQKQEKSFACESCHKCFSTISCLRIHQKLFHFEYVPTSSCQQCESHFKWKHHLTAHKYSNSSEDTSMCNTYSINTTEESCAPDECKEASVEENDDDVVLDLSRTHQKSDVSDSENHVCYFCQEKFLSKSDLSKHVLVHTEEKAFTCKYCGKCFTKKMHLNTHIEIHTKKTSFICNICQKNFTHAGFLRRHLRLHSEGKLFVCSICHNVFPDKVTLEEHLSIHDDKSFICNLCFKKFAFQDDLDCHIPIHSHEKPYPCDFCERRFVRKRCLDTHITRLHSNQKPA